MHILLSLAKASHHTRQTGRAEQAALAAQVAQAQQENDALAYAVDHKDDPEVLEQVARDKGFVKAGEKLFVDIAN